MEQTLSFVRKGIIALSLLLPFADSAIAGQIPVPANTALTILFTDTIGPRCKDDPDEHVSVSTCPGPAGYAVRIWDEGNIVGLTIAPAALLDRTEGQVVGRGGGDFIGDKIQWVLRGSVPKAAVLRTRWPVFDDTSGEIVGKTENLLVFAIHGAQVCVYSAIDARTAYANDAALALARKAASSPSEKHCNGFSPENGVR